MLLSVRITGIFFLIGELFLFQSIYFGVIRIMTVVFIGAIQSQSLLLVTSLFHGVALQGVLLLGTSHTSLRTSVAALRKITS